MLIIDKVPQSILYFYKIKIDNGKKSNQTDVEAKGLNVQQRIKYCQISDIQNLFAKMYASITPL